MCFFQVSLNHKFSTPEFEQKVNELKYNHGYKCLRAPHYLSSIKLNKSTNPLYLVVGIWLTLQNSLLEIFSALKNPHYSMYNSSQRSYSTYSLFLITCKILWIWFVYKYCLIFELVIYQNYFLGDTVKSSLEIPVPLQWVTTLFWEITLKCHKCRIIISLHWKQMTKHLVWLYHQDTNTIYTGSSIKLSSAVFTVYWCCVLCIRYRSILNWIFNLKNKSKNNCKQTCTLLFLTNQYAYKIKL